MLLFGHQPIQLKQQSLKKSVGNLLSFLICLHQVFICFLLPGPSPSQSNKIIEQVRVTLLVPTAVVEHMPCQEHILHEFLDTIRVPFDMFDGLT